MSTGRIRSFVLRCSIVVALVGCGGSGATVCSNDTECPSHFCKADNTCGPVELDAPLQSSDASGDGITGLCTPNHDGTISQDELPLIAGRAATFRSATSANWNTAGTSNTDGSRTWDLTVQLSGDADDVVTLAAPAGAWWQSDFPTATYAVPLTSTSDLIGVFAFTATGVTLLGVVSPTGGATQTELKYDPPAQILAVPFSAGSTWTSTSTVTGTAEGVLADYSETYASSVDQVGTMKTPYGDFPVLRVATNLTRSEGIATLLTNRTFAWVAECFGSVATVQSQSNESGTEFSDDAEVRRLAP